MAISSQQQTVLGILWIVAGALLVLAFLMPLYGAAFYDMNGFELQDITRSLDDEKLGRFDRVTGIMMVVVPVLGVFLGFWGVIGGIFRVMGKSVGAVGLFQILCGLNLVLGVYVAVQLGQNGGGLLGAFMPQPQIGFFVMMLGMLVLLLPDLVVARLARAES